MKIQAAALFLLFMLFNPVHAAQRPSCSWEIARFSQYMPKAIQDRLNSAEPLADKCKLLHSDQVGVQLFDLESRLGEDNKLHNVTILCIVKDEFTCSAPMARDWTSVEDVGRSDKLSLLYLGDESSPGSFSGHPKGMYIVDPIDDDLISEALIDVANTLGQEAEQGEVPTTQTYERLANYMRFLDKFEAASDTPKEFKDKFDVVRAQWVMIANMYHKRQADKARRKTATTLYAFPMTPPPSVVAYNDPKTRPGSDYWDEQAAEATYGRNTIDLEVNKTEQVVREMFPDVTQAELQSVCFGKVHMPVSNIANLVDWYHISYDQAQMLPSQIAFLISPSGEVLHMSGFNKVQGGIDYDHLVPIDQPQLQQVLLSHTKIAESAFIMRTGYKCSMPVTFDMPSGIISFGLTQ